MQLYDFKSGKVVKFKKPSGFSLFGNKNKVNQVADANAAVGALAGSHAQFGSEDDATRSNNYLINGKYRIIKEIGKGYYWFYLTLLMHS